jgi:hypothetical protein
MKKNDKLIIRLVKNISIAMIIITLGSLVIGLIFYLSQISQIIDIYEKSFPIVILSQTLGQLKTAWNTILVAIAFLGGIQIMILLMRNRKMLQKFSKH